MSLVALSAQVKLTSAADAGYTSFDTADIYGPSEGETCTSYDRRGKPGGDVQDSSYSSYRSSSCSNHSYSSNNYSYTATITATRQQLQLHGNNYGYTATITATAATSTATGQQ